MSIEENKAVVGRWFSEFWGKDFNPAVIDELAAPDIRFEYSLHAPLRGRDAVRSFAGKFRAAFPDLNFWGTADLIAEGDYVVGQWEGGGTHTGDAFADMPVGSLPANLNRSGFLRFGYRLCWCPVSGPVSFWFPRACALCCPVCPGAHRLRLRRDGPPFALMG
jgi:SnoaL-like polyketide cyclase